MHGERRTVLIALTANAVIAIAKLVGGMTVGSAAMLAEARTRSPTRRIRG